jgi:hypothetical protein
MWSKIYKSSSVTIRTSDMLKKKFSIAIGTLNMSQILEPFMHEYVRNYERDFWVITVNPNQWEMIDVIKKHLWIQITDNQYKRLLENNAPRYWRISLDKDERDKIDKHSKDKTD